MAFTKWLRILAYMAIISLVNSAFDFLPFVPASISTWVSKGLTAATIYCAFNLSGMNNRYQKAALFRTVSLGCSLIAAFLFRSYILSIAVTIFSVLAVYQEYTAHAEVAADKDTTLSRKWRRLFCWNLLAAILLSLGSGVTAVILALSELSVDASKISGIVILLLKTPQFAIYVIRFVYLHKMIAYFLPEEV